MLNDFFISRDVIGHLQSYLADSKSSATNYSTKLDHYMQKQRISYAQWWRLLAELEEIDSSPALGIDIGKRIKVEHVGVLGYLFRTSRNVGEALSAFKRFQGLIYAGSIAHIEQIYADSISLVWNPDYGYSSQTSDELLLAVMANIVREIVYPDKVNLHSVDFTQVMSEQRQRYCEQFFACPVRHSQERLSISFPSKDLSLAIPHSDSTLNEILGQKAEDLLVSLPDCDTFIADLTDTIIRCLHEGHADTSAIASRMGMSERTLHRKLKSKGRVFREILQEIRKSMVVNYLKDPKLTLSEIALLLGYSEQSSFTRAFSAWYGCSPLIYKKSKLSLN